MPNFIFTVLTSDYNSNLTTFNPIVDVSNSFVGLSNDIVSNGGTTTITYSWTGYTDTGSNDGLQISGNASFGLNVASLNITQFDGIPLTRASTSGFAGFSGQITATDSPTILSNTNFTSLFQDSTISTSNFGNIGSWDTSSVSNMSSMFQGCITFNQSAIGLWNFSNVNQLTNFITNTGYTPTQYGQFLDNLSANITLPGGLTLGANGLSRYNSLIETNSYTKLTSAIASGGKNMIITDSVIYLYSFVYTVSTNYIINSTTLNPIININNSFTDLSIETINNGDGTTTVYWYWSAFNDNGTTNDGLQINGNANFNLNNASLNIQSFGGIPLSRASTSAFAGFSGQITATDSPTILSNTNFTSLFSGSTISSSNFGNIGSWVISNVINMSNMFYGCTGFNQPIDSWTPVAVTNMQNMFQGCTSFNQPVGSWSTGTVTNMASIFQGCTSFNQSIGSWTTTNVTNMSSMFQGCTAFNQSAVGSWNFTNVITLTNFITNSGYNPDQYGQFLDNLSANTTLPTGLILGTVGLSRYNKVIETNSYIHLTTAVASGGKNMTITDTVITLYSFIYTVSTTDYTDNSGSINPIVNANNSFANLTYETINNGNGTTTVYWYWSAFTDTGSTVDGLKINGNANFHLNVASLNINNFNGIPLSRSSTSAFAGFSGQISASDSPTILSNTNFTSLFSGSTIDTANFGNIGSWTTDNVINMSNMFYGCTGFNQNISGWSTGSVTNMTSMFQGCIIFNQDISGWTTGAVTNMSSMFYGCSAFNQSAVGSWNFTHVTNITNIISSTGYNPTQYNLFLYNLSNSSLPTGLTMGTTNLVRYSNTITNNAYAKLTNTIINNGKNLTIIDSILYQFIFSILTADYNSYPDTINPIINTDQSFANLTHTIVNNGNGSTTITWSWTAFTDNGTTHDGLLLYGNTNFLLNVASLNIKQFNGIALTRQGQTFRSFSGQNTSDDYPTILSSTSFFNLFANSTVSSISFGNIGSWNVSGVTYANAAFSGCTSFNKDISSWNTSNITDMESMFNGCSAFNQNIGSWNTSKVVNMVSMFNGCSVFNSPLTSWNTSSVTTMNYMFGACNSFNQPIHSWDVSKVTSMSYMFTNCNIFNQDLSLWAVSAVTNMSYMFYACGAFNQNLISWNTSAVTNMQSMFQGCTSFKQSNIGSWSLTSVTNITNMITSTGYSVAQYSLFVINLGANASLPLDLALGTTGLTRYINTITNNAYALLVGSKNLTIGDTGVTTNSFIFTVSTSDYTSRSGKINPILNVNNSFTNLSSYVVSSEGITTIYWYWTIFTNNGTTTDGLKINGNANFQLNVSSLNITNFGGIPLSRASSSAFAGFSGQISASDSPIILTNTNFTSLFSGSTVTSANFGNIGSWSTSTVINMYRMFYGCTGFNQPIGSWSTGAVTNMSQMFQGCTSFNQSIGSWSLASVTNISSMFSGCTSFNQSNIGSWSIPNVTNILNMITGAGYTIAQYSQFLVNLSINSSIRSNLILGTTGFIRYNNMVTNTAYNYLTVNKHITITDASITTYSFIFTVSTSDYTTYSGAINPILNANNSFANISKNVINNGNGTHSIYWYWTAFTDNGTTTDGLQINGNANFQLNVPSLNITNFNGIPLSRASANAFAGFSGQLSASDYPTILSNTDFTGLFYGSTVASANFGNIGSWSMSNVINMSQMFYGCTSFNQSIGSWATTNVTNMSGMFQGCTSFNRAISSWSTANVTNMSNMFQGCIGFNQAIGSWSTANVTNMANMFQGCTAFNQFAVGSWNFTNVITLTNFITNSGYNPDQYGDFLDNLSANTTLPTGLILGADGLSRYNKVIETNSYIHLTTAVASGGKNMTITDTVITLYSFIYIVSTTDYTNNSGAINPIVNTNNSFANLTYETINNGNGTTTVYWYWSAFTDTGSTVDGLKINGNANFHLNVASLNITNFGSIQLTRSSTSAFAGFSGQISASDSPTILSNTNFTSLFSGSTVDTANFGNIGSWTTDNVINMSNMFYGCTRFNQPIGSWSTGSVTNMQSMFQGCTGFNQVISAWSTGVVTNMQSMFQGCTGFNQPVGSWSTSAVTNMQSMFQGCLVFNQPMGSWSTGAVTNMSNLFNGCRTFNNNISSWDVSNVTDMSNLFSGCIIFNNNISSWDVSNVTDMSYLFSGCSAFNQPLKSWNVSNVINMTNLFSGCSAFNQPLV